LISGGLISGGLIPGGLSLDFCITFKLALVLFGFTRLTDRIQPVIDPAAVESTRHPPFNF
jgi:hypothetical protein